MTALRNDAPAMLALGKAALARDLALDLYAFPDIGVPQHRPIGPAIDRSVIYSVARTESAFDQRDPIAGQGGRPDAGHARSGARHRQEDRHRL